MCVIFMTKMPYSRKILFPSMRESYHNYQIWGWRSVIESDPDTTGAAFVANDDGGRRNWIGSLSGC